MDGRRLSMLGLTALALGASLYLANCGGGASPPVDASGTVTLSAERIAGPGGALHFGGDTYTGSLDAPATALVGVVRADGTAYFHHAAQGDAEASLQTSRLALGYYMAGYGVDVPDAEANSQHASIRVDDLGIGEYAKLDTGVFVYRLSREEVSVKNLSRRAIAVKPVHNEAPADPDDARVAFLVPNTSAFLTGQSLGLAELLRSRYIGWRFETAEEATLHIQSGVLETYGAFIRCAPMWRSVLDPTSLLEWPPMPLSALATEYSEAVVARMPSGVREALLSDALTFGRVNALDLMFAVFGAIRYVGKAFTPEFMESAVDAWIGIGEALAYTWGAEGLDADGRISCQVLLTTIEDLAQTGVGTVTEGLEVGWSAWDAVCLTAWAFDQAVATQVDAAAPAYATVGIPYVAPPTYWSGYGTNLVQNEGGEQGASSHNGVGGEDLVRVDIPSWTWLGSSDGTGYVLEYAQSGGGVGLGSGGKYLVAAAASGSAPSLVQDIDLSPIRSDIEAGRVTYTLEASIGVGGPASAEMGIAADYNAHVAFGWRTGPNPSDTFVSIDSVYQPNSEGPAKLRATGPITGVYRSDYCVTIWGGSADDVSLVLQASAL